MFQTIDQAIRLMYHHCPEWGWFDSLPNNLYITIMLFCSQFVIFICDEVNHGTVNWSNGSAVMSRSVPHIFVSPRTDTDSVPCWDPSPWIVCSVYSLRVAVNRGIVPCLKPKKLGCWIPNPKYDCHFQMKCQYLSRGTDLNRSRCQYLSREH